MRTINHGLRWRAASSSGGQASAAPLSGALADAAAPATYGRKPSGSGLQYGSQVVCPESSKQACAPSLFWVRRFLSRPTTSAGISGIVILPKRLGCQYLLELAVQLLRSLPAWTTKVLVGEQSWVDGNAGVPSLGHLRCEDRAGECRPSSPRSPRSRSTLDRSSHDARTGWCASPAGHACATRGARAGRVPRSAACGLGREDGAPAPGGERLCCQEGVGRRLPRLVPPTRPR